MPLRRGRLADIQAQQVEVGRIRLGSSTPKVSRAGKPYNEPVKLESFRLTSRSQLLIQEAASIYGGECAPWEPQGGGAQQWQVLTQRRSIEVVVPPDPLSQAYEQWQGGKCIVRCDGVRELIEDQPCICGPDPSNRRCKPTTRLNLMLSEMSGIGVWRLETHGYFAAAELPGVVDLLTAVGGYIPARLEMEQRQATVPDPRKPGEEMITRFMVPVLHVARTAGQMVQMITGNGAPPHPAIAAPVERPALPAQPSTYAVDGDGSNATKDGEPYDPTQERLRQQWTIHTDFESQIAAAGDMGRLREIANAIRQAGLDQQFQDSLRLRWRDRQAALGRAAQSEGQPERVPQPPPEATGTSRGTVDRQAEMLAIQATAAAVGLTLSGLKAAYTQFTNGGAMSQATGEQLAEFHLHLKDGGGS